MTTTMAMAAWEAQAIDDRTGFRRMAAGEWAAYHYLKKAAAADNGSEVIREAVRLAAVDLREAESFHTAISQVWPVDAWKPIHSDAGLFHLVALLYLSELLLDKDDEFQACLTALKGSMSAAELTTLLQFGRCLSPKDLSQFCDADRAVVAIQKIGPDMCRSPLEYVDEIVRSSYCVSNPRRDCGAACATALTYIRQQITAAETPQLVELFARLERGVVECYAKETVVLSEADWEAYFEESFEEYSCNDKPAWGPFTVAEARRLLSALCDTGSLLTQLVTRRPPNSVFSSHLLALYDCTTHARLWLLSARATNLLPIYGPFPLAYKDVGRGWEKYLDSSRGKLVPQRSGSSASTLRLSHLNVSFASDDGGTDMTSNVDSSDDDSDAYSAEIGPIFYGDEDAIRRTELAALSSPIGFMERVPSFVERAAKEEALDEYLDWHVSGNKTRGTLLSVFKSPRCERVKIPRIVTGGLSSSLKPVPGVALEDPLNHSVLLEDLDVTLWYEPPLKLQYWLAGEPMKLAKYRSMSAFLDPSSRLRFRN